MLSLNEFSTIHLSRIERNSWIQLKSIVRNNAVFLYVSFFFWGRNNSANSYLNFSEIFRLISVCALRNIPLLIFTFSVCHHPTSDCMMDRVFRSAFNGLLRSTNTCYKIFSGIMLQFTSSSFSHHLFTRYLLMENQHRRCNRAGYVTFSLYQYGFIQ